MSSGSGVSIVSTVNFEHLNSRLTDAENRVFRQHQRKVLGRIKDMWQGWLYRGRAHDAPRNVSQDKWKSRVETTESKARLFVFNNATTKRGKKYAGYVHRAGTRTLYWTVVLADLETSIFPALRADLTKAVLATVGQRGPPKKLRGRSGRGATARGGEEL